MQWMAEGGELGRPSSVEQAQTIHRWLCPPWCYQPILLPQSLPVLLNCIAHVRSPGSETSHLHPYSWHLGCGWPLGQNFGGPLGYPSDLRWGVVEQGCNARVHHLCVPTMAAQLQLGCVSTEILHLRCWIILLYAGYCISALCNLGLK